jgi:hypothetical protein
MISKRVLQKYVEEIDSILAVNTMMNRSLFTNYCVMYNIHMCEKDAYTVRDRSIEYSIWVHRNNNGVEDCEVEDCEAEDCDYSLIVKDSLNNIPVEIYSI